MFWARMGTSTYLILGDGNVEDSGHVKRLIESICMRVNPYPFLNSFKRHGTKSLLKCDSTVAYANLIICQVSDDAKNTKAGVDR